MKEKEDFLPFPIVSAVSGEFSPEFLAWWPFRGVPLLMNHVSPYKEHIERVVGLKYIFRPEVGGWVIAITSYCGMWKAYVYRMGSYRGWVDSSIKGLDKKSVM